MNNNICKSMNKKFSKAALAAMTATAVGSSYAPPSTYSSFDVGISSINPNSHYGGVATYSNTLQDPFRTHQINAHHDNFMDSRFQVSDPFNLNTNQHHDIQVSEYANVDLNNIQNFYGQFQPDPPANVLHVENHNFLGDPIPNNHIAASASTPFINPPARDNTQPPPRDYYTNRTNRQQNNNNKQNSSYSPFGVAAGAAGTAAFLYAGRKGHQAFKSVKSQYDKVSNILSNVQATTGALKDIVFNSKSAAATALVGSTSAASGLIAGSVALAKHIKKKKQLKKLLKTSLYY
jgi:hypothetical protein